MNTPEFWIMILGIWIFVLQRKIEHLEERVESLGASQKRIVISSKNTEKIPAAAEETVCDEVKSVDTSAERQKHIVNDISSVEVLEQTYNVSRKKESTEQEPSKMMTFITEYFTGGNLLVRIGGIILFFGLAFLVKYAAEHSVISIQMRLWGIAAASTVLIGLGWRLRGREGAYGQILQGLGVAMLYLVIYGAAKFYAMLSLDVAFILMLAVVLLGSVLAVLENALPLALFATAGGFLVPILTSGGQGSPVVLFSYYAFLNVGVFIVAWYRSWRALNVAGFVFTFVIATVWGVLRYRSELFTSVEPFLILYFIMYLGIAVLFTVKHPFEPKNFVDSTLVFGLPIVAFPLQLHLVQNIPYGDAWSAGILGMLYLALWQWLKKKERTLLLGHSFLVLSVLFFTITIPYIFDADVSAALWSLEGTAAIWLGLKQGRMLTRYFGMLILSISLFVYPGSVGSYGLTAAEYLGYLIVITASFVSAYWLDIFKQDIPYFDHYVAKGFIALGVLWWFRGTLYLLHGYWHGYKQGQDILLVLDIGTVLLLTVASFIRWKVIVDMLQAVLPFGLVVFVSFRESGQLFFHPFLDWGAPLLGVLFIMQFMMLYRYRAAWHYDKILHLLTLWFMVLVVAMEVYYQVELREYKEVSYGLIPLVAVPLAVSFVLLIPLHYNGWLEAYRKSYQLIGTGVLTVCSLVWEVDALGEVSPSIQHYFPLFNILDIVQTAAVLLAGFWLYRNRRYLHDHFKKTGYVVLGFLSILLVSVIFARAVHAYQNVPYTIFALWHSEYLQTGLSLLWSLIAITLMLFSKHYVSRGLWMGGFSLIAAVVLKLFFVELASSGTVERIISFIIVGGLLLLIGYFAPLPPGRDKRFRDEKK